MQARKQQEKIKRAEKKAEEKTKKFQEMARGSLPLTRFFAVLPAPVKPPRISLPIKIEEQQPELHIPVEQSIEDVASSTDVLPVADIFSPDPVSSVTLQADSPDESILIMPLSGNMPDPDSSSEEDFEPSIKRFKPNPSSPVFFNTEEANTPALTTLNLPFEQTPKGKGWIKRVISQLKRHSDNSTVNKTNPFKSLAAQWVATGQYEDLEQGCEDCELCDKESIRYKFEIRNTINDKRLWVGSSCITHFAKAGLSYQEAGQFTPMSQIDSLFTINEMVNKTEKEGQKHDREMRSFNNMN